MPLNSSVHKPEHNWGLCLSGWFDFKVMMRSKGDRHGDGNFLFWMQHHWAVKGEEAQHVLIELSSLTDWFASDVQTGFCLKSHDTKHSRPTVSAGGLFTQFPIRSVCTRDLMGNPIQLRAWLITKENVLSVSPLSVPPSPPGPYLKYLEVDGGTSLLEAVSCAPMRGASLVLIWLWVAPYSAQHEAILHS